MGTAIAVRADAGWRCRRRTLRRRGGYWESRTVLDGNSRTEAAKIGGMDRQTLRDRVITAAQ